ncbi:MAG TPA: ROK family protein [Bacteroidia bacterium]|jgi:glucokinase|nr:ROK family protein [Bacteroidia bacterium]
MKTQVVAGIDIGGTNTEIALVDREGKVLFSSKLSTKAHSTPESWVEATITILKDGLRSTGANLVATGIGAPSANYFSGCIEFAPNMPWAGKIPLAEMVEKETFRPCKITNDANAAALGEQLFGSAKWLKDFVVVTLGTGLGSGFIVNDQVMYGHDGFAGELGHVIVEHNGRLCGCTRHGCLETYVSATGIVTTAKDFLSFMGDLSILNEIPLDKLESRHIAEAAEKGDKVAINILGATAEKLAFALANMVAITSPSHIFLYGGLAKAGKFILDPTRKYFESYLLRNYAGKVKIELSGLPDHAAVLGAAALAWKELS